MSGMNIDVKVIIFGVLLLVMYIINYGFIFADLMAGVRKARKAGVARTSEGYKRTIDKLAKYSNAMFGLTLVDAIQFSVCYALYHYYDMDIVLLPWFTTGCVAYIGFVEIKSICEPYDEKERRQMKNITALAAEILKHRTEPEEIAKAVGEYLTKKDNE